MKKILIFYGSYGGGHLSAAKSIKEYIDTNYEDTETMMVDFMEYINKVLNKVTTKAYAEMAKNAHWMWGRVYYSAEDGAVSKLSNAAQKLLANKLNKLLQEYNPDIIISTHPFSSQMCAILKKKKEISCKLATIITDYEPHKQWLAYPQYVDYFFVAHNGMKENLMKRRIKENQIKVTGIPLSSRFLLNYNKEEIFNEFNLDSNKKTILFFAGGEQGFGKDKILKIFKTLIENFTDAQIIAISGKNLKIKNSFDSMVLKENANKNVKILEYTNKIPELMNIADLVITKPGGLTTTESLASGLPIIVINPIPGQEEANAEFLEKNGAAVWLKKESDINEVLSDILNNPDKLEQMKNTAQKLAKKKSTENICKTLLN